MTCPKTRPRRCTTSTAAAASRPTGPALLVRKSLMRQGVAVRHRTTSTRSATPRSTSSPPPARTRRRATSTASAPTTCTATRCSRSAARNSDEPDYIAQRPQHRRGAGGVRRHDDGQARLHARPRTTWARRATGFFDNAKHWQYRLGVTQILTPRWMASAELRGALRRRLPRQPLPRRARVRRRGAGAQSAHALEPRAQARARSATSARATRCTPTTATSGTPGTSRRTRSRSATAATSASRGWPTPSLRYYTQSKALFYSDNAHRETTYVSRNRQLSTFNSFAPGAQRHVLVQAGARPVRDQGSPAPTSTSTSSSTTSPTSAPASRTRTARTCCSCYVTATF